MRCCQILNGFKKMFTGGKKFEEDGVLYAITNPVYVKFAVCVAVSEITFVDMDVQCSKGFEVRPAIKGPGPRYALLASTLL